jgi:hypothetical protein
MAMTLTHISGASRHAWSSLSFNNCSMADFEMPIKADAKNGNSYF